MNDHDLTPDLEALLVDAATGDLDPEGAARLRAALAEHPRLADLLEEQRAIAARLDPGPAAALTDLERARLRRSVLDEVGGGDPVPATPNPRPAPWARWAFAAAAALVVVVASVGLLGGGLDDGLDSVGSEIASAPTDTERVTAGQDAADDAAPEADLGAAAESGDESVADGSEESALARPACPIPGRSIEDLVGRAFDEPTDARSAAASTDPDTFSGEAEPVEGPDRVTWVWRDEAGVETAVLEVVWVGDDWRIEVAEACG